MSHLGVDISDMESWKEYFADNCIITTNYVEISDGTKLIVVNSKPTEPIKGAKNIILISGWFAQPISWIGTLRLISKYCNVVYIESREKKSSFPPSRKADFSLEQMATDLREIKQHFEFDIKDAILTGSSMGGSIILQYLITNGKEEIDENPFMSVLVGPNPKIDVPRLIAAIFLRLPVFMYGLVLKYASWHILKFRIDEKADPDQAAKYNNSLANAVPWKVKASANAVLKFNLWEELPLIKSDVVLVGAKMDKLHGAEVVAEIGRKIPNAKYYEFYNNREVHSGAYGEFLIKLATGNAPDLTSFD